MSVGWVEESTSTSSGGMLSSTQLKFVPSKRSIVRNLTLTVVIRGMSYIWFVAEEEEKKNTRLESRGDDLRGANQQRVGYIIYSCNAMQKCTNGMELCFPGFLLFLT